MLNRKEKYIEPRFREVLIWFGEIVFVAVVVATIFVIGEGSALIPSIIVYEAFSLIKDTWYLLLLLAALIKLRNTNSISSTEAYITCLVVAALVLLGTTYSII